MAVPQWAPWASFAATLVGTIISALAITISLLAARRARADAREEAWRQERLQEFQATEQALRALNLTTVAVHEIWVNLLKLNWHLSETPSPEEHEIAAALRGPCNQINVALGIGGLPIKWLDRLRSLQELMHFWFAADPMEAPLEGRRRRVQSDIVVARSLWDDLNASVLSSSDAPKG
jgi:hypothetical protein